jgi:hypothetical protein
MLCHSHPFLFDHCINSEKKYIMQFPPSFCYCVREAKEMVIIWSKYTATYIDVIYMPGNWKKNMQSDLWSDVWQGRSYVMNHYYNLFCSTVCIVGYEQVF